MKRDIRLPKRLGDTQIIYTMQTSKKILLTVAGVLLALFVSSLMLLRTDIKRINEQAKLDNPLVQVPVTAFEALQFSGRWEVQVRQGRAYKVELSFDEQNRYLPLLNHSNDTLFFSIRGDSSMIAQARVVTPFIKSIEALGGATVTLKNFNLDSMTVVLNSSRLVAKENKLAYTSYQTSGNSLIEFIDDPMK